MLVKYMQFIWWVWDQSPVWVVKFICLGSMEQAETVLQRWISYLP